MAKLLCVQCLFQDGNAAAFASQPGLRELCLKASLMPFDRLAEMVAGGSSYTAFGKELIMDKEQ